MVEDICLTRKEAQLMNEQRLSLAGKEWRDFLLMDYFSFKKGNQSNMASLQEGDIPLVSARKMNNGYKDFVRSNGKELFPAGILTINNDGDGGAGLSYYQPYTMALDSHVTALIPKIQMSKHLLMFIARCISHQHKRFGNGYPINERRINKFRFLLPVSESDNMTPDWAFMEAYMRQKEQELLKPTIGRLCKRLIINELTGGGNSLDTNWKAFYFTEVFTEIQRGKRLKKADHIQGNSPYVSATALNNGVDGFVGNASGIRSFSDCLTVANSGSVGSAFFHQYEFVASDHVTQLKREGLDKYAYLFMIPLINRLAEKYSFNREINDERIKREKILLPVTESGEIDFAFMSSFMKNVEKDILSTTLKIFSNRLNVNKLKMGGGNMEELSFA